MAAALAAKYRLPEAQVAKHLASGRFRVKTNLDLIVAQKFAAELEAMGAVVSVDEATSALVKPPAPAGHFTSGLSAAYGPSASQEMALGALETFDVSSHSMPSLSLSSLDGSDDSPATLATPVLPAPSSPRAEAAPPPPRDAFAAPDSQEEELVLALPQAAPKPKPQTLAPAASSPASTAPTKDLSVRPPLRRPSAESVSVSEDDVPADQAPLMERPRARFVLGLLLALVIGYLPAHLYSSHAESRDFAAIRLEVVEAQKGDLSLLQWEDLAIVRADAQRRMASARTRIFVSTLVLWLLCGSGVGYLWWRRFS